jgi:hypothetical protein
VYFNIIEVKYLVNGVGVGKDVIGGEGGLMGEM